MNTLQRADYIVFFIYFIVVASYGYDAYRRKQSTVTDSKDLFLAEGSLTWWAISSYEWMSAAALIIVASLAGKGNSISTIYCMDIYHKFFNRVMGILAHCIRFTGSRAMRPELNLHT